MGGHALKLTGFEGEPHRGRSVPPFQEFRAVVEAVNQGQDTDPRGCPHAVAPWPFRDTNAIVNPAFGVVTARGRFARRPWAGPAGCRCSPRGEHRCDAGAAAVGRIEQEFGLTPAARSRLWPESAPPVDDEIAHLRQKLFGTPHPSIPALASAGMGRVPRGHGLGMGAGARKPSNADHGTGGA